MPVALLDPVVSTMALSPIIGYASLRSALFPSVCFVWFIPKSAYCSCSTANSNHFLVTTVSSPLAQALLMRAHCASRPLSLCWCINSPILLVGLHFQHYQQHCSQCCRSSHLSAIRVSSQCILCSPFLFMAIMAFVSITLFPITAPPSFHKGLLSNSYLVPKFHFHMLHSLLTTLSLKHAPVRFKY